MYVESIEVPPRLGSGGEILYRRLNFRFIYPLSEFIPPIVFVEKVEPCPCTKLRHSSGYLKIELFYFLRRHLLLLFTVFPYLVHVDSSAQ